MYKFLPWTTYIYQYINYMYFNTSRICDDLVSGVKIPVSESRQQLSTH